MRLQRMRRIVSLSSLALVGRLHAAPCDAVVTFQGRQATGRAPLGLNEQLRQIHHPVLDSQDFNRVVMPAVE